MLERNTELIMKEDSSVFSISSKFMGINNCK